MRNLIGVVTLTLLTGGAASGSETEPVTVIRDPMGPLTLRTSAAEFRLTPSGEVEGTLIVAGRRLGLQEKGGPGDSVEIAGTGHLAVGLDLAGAGITDVQGPLGTGKRVEVRGRSQGGATVERVLAIEVYADFPSLAVSTVTYRNVGPRPLTLARVVQQSHRLNASLADAKAAPYGLWSFHGASVEWGQDELLPLAPGFSRPNVLAAQLPNGSGGGVPVVAFWTATVGAAVGHLEAFPVVASLPVAVEKDGRI
ncbi:MAG TPA: hypothetical protein VL691_17020, partial [Vicinamibacteria bacterium]|nr:hypothetical protein [Vicinamibacteria bacterium]